MPTFLAALRAVLLAGAASGLSAFLAFLSPTCTTCRMPACFAASMRVSLALLTGLSALGLAGAFLRSSLVTAFSRSAMTSSTHARVKLASLSRMPTVKPEIRPAMTPSPASMARMPRLLKRARSSLNRSALDSSLPNASSRAASKIESKFAGSSALDCSCCSVTLTELMSRPMPVSAI